MMQWLDKLKGKKEKVVDELSNEEQRRAILDKEKEDATRAGKAWVAVLDTQVNPENIRNGFFEIDWNNQFIEDYLMQVIAENQMNKLLTHGSELL